MPLVYMTASGCSQCAELYMRAELRGNTKKVLPAADVNHGESL